MPRCSHSFSPGGTWRMPRRRLSSAIKLSFQPTALRYTSSQSPNQHRMQTQVNPTIDRKHSTNAQTLHVTRQVGGFSALTLSGCVSPRLNAPGVAHGLGWDSVLMTAPTCCFMATAGAARLPFDPACTRSVLPNPALISHPRLHPTCSSTCPPFPRLAAPFFSLRLIALMFFLWSTATSSSSGRVAAEDEEMWG